MRAESKLAGEDRASEVELGGGTSSQIFLFFSVGTEVQVEVVAVAVVQHDPSGWPLVGTMSLWRDVARS